MSIILRPDQDECMEAVRDKLRAGHKRILLQSPCGSGKTAMGSFMAKGTVSNGRRVMFTAHREELLRQTGNTMRRIELPFGYIAAGMTPNPRMPVQIASIDTLRRRYDKVPRPDLMIVDEAHHAASAGWRRIIDYYADLGTVIIGLSATPSRLSGEPLDMFETMVIGPSIRRLIEIGALCDYEYYAPPTKMDLSGLKSSYGDFDQGAAEEAADKPTITGDAIKHYQRIMPGKRAIVFAVSIRHSEHIAEQFNANDIPALHIDGTMASDVRRQRLESFNRGETKVLCNVELFGEGFDLPALDGVIMLRPTKSLGLYIQQSGRSLRPHESKEKAIILDHCANWMTHGLPDEDREWTLEGRKKRPKDDDEISVKTRQCPTCFRVHLFLPACPYCGHVYEVVGREVIRVDGELEKLTPDMIERIRVEKKREVQRADTLEALQDIARERGYKPQWAEHIWRARHGRKDRGELERAKALFEGS